MRLFFEKGWVMSARCCPRQREAKANVAKPVDASDLKSDGGQPPCGFESRRWHLFHIQLTRGQRALITKIFVTSVAQPHTQHLGHFLTLGLAQGFIEEHRLFALTTASAIIVCIPKAARFANPTADLLNQGLSGQRLLVVLFCWHWEF